MAGRPRKKPEYNPELQFNNFLQELRDAYEEASSLRSLADELNISLLKLRKLLITADVFTSDICTEINELYQAGKKIPEIMELTGLSRASVHSYLPYTKGLYNAAEISLNAERCRTYKIRQTHRCYVTREENSLKKMQSLMAVACKLIRVFYAILTKGATIMYQSFWEILNVQGRVEKGIL